MNMNLLVEHIKEICEFYRAASQANNSQGGKLEKFVLKEVRDTVFLWIVYVDVITLLHLFFGQKRLFGDIELILIQESYHHNLP